LTCTVAASAADRPDILIADFEGKDYGSWKATGEAFGPGPARGTLPNQMAVSGFEGKGLVNSYYRGDDTTGTLTSPPFKIERKYINFLIGGGRYPGKACVNLMVEGKIVRTATGPNDRPGGTERLEWHSWDVGDLEGKSAVIEIVDQQKGGWGHINIDHIVMADRKRSLEPARREIAVASRYLHFPVNNGASMRTVRLSAEGSVVREFEIELAEGSVDLWAFTDVSAFRGRRLTIEAQLTAGSRALEAVTQGDAIKDTDNLYREKHRPQFHFTPLRGWTNDPNGLVYYKGEYHLFFQHNPFGTKWGNMTWGHAVSPDLVHWTELGDAIHPDRLGTIFSGSAVVDHHNTTGFRTGEEKPIVCIFTSAGGTSAWSNQQPFAQSLAYSNDRGRSWTTYAGNPVLKHIVGGNRDPKVVWHEPIKRWIMALYLDKHDYGLFGSPNLKDWTQLQTITMPDCGECPDFFPMPVDGDAKNVKWVFTAANGRYLVGDFDGKKYVPSGRALDANWGGWYYAVQSFSDIPASDGRRIQVAWMAGGNYPGMPFNQQMNFPCEMTLRSLPEGLRICRNPVREIESLRTKTHSWGETVVKPGENPLAPVKAELLDIESEIEPGLAAEFGFEIRGERLIYSTKNRTLAFLDKSAKVEPIDGRVRLRILIDRTTIEVYANDGRVPMSFCWLPKPGDRRPGLFAVGGSAKIVSLRVHELKSAWQR
jgi:fructan beta-fructosidase